jgi:ABC-type Co2+ transport system permease subunit
MVIYFYSFLEYKMPDKKEAPSMMPDMSDLMTRLVKYAFEGVAVALAAYFFSGKLKINEIGMISLTAMATFAILDVYAPSVGASARTGAGFGIGAGLVGFPA